MKNDSIKKKKKGKSILPKAITIFMLIATVALYVSTIIYQVIGN